MSKHKKLSTFLFGIKLWEIPGFMQIYKLARALLGDNYNFWFVYPLQKYRESYELEVFNNLLTPGMTILDIGANMGLYTTLAAKSIGAKGKIFAFEPEPNNVSILKKNLKKHLGKDIKPSIEIIQMAVIDKISSKRLYLDSLAPDNNSLTKQNVITGDSYVNIKTTGIDSFLKGKSTKVDLIKTDAQGSEGLIIEGAKKTIKKDKPIILLEYWPSGLIKAGYNPKKHIEQIMNLGYQIFEINNSQRKLIKLTQRSINRLYATNPKNLGYTNLLLRPR